MPQYEVQFLSGLKAEYTAIPVKDNFTFYLCTDTNELYIGTELLTNAGDLAAAITRIAANEGNISSLQSAVNTLNGDVTTDGSVRKIAAEAVAQIVAEAPEDLDTLKEIADWIVNHASDAAAMNSAIIALQNLVGTLPESASSTNLVDYVAEYLDKNGYSPFNVEKANDVLIIPAESYSGDRTATTLSFPHAIAVEDKAFWDAEMLQTIDLPLVQIVGEKAFESCIALTEIDLPKATAVGKDSYAMCMFAASLNAPMLKIVGNGAFQNTAINKIDLPSAEIIEDVGFGGSFYATEISIPMVQIIGSFAFQNAQMVESLTLDEVKSIGDLAFYDCTKLKSVYINTDYVPSAGQEIFKQSPMDTADPKSGEIEGKIYVQGKLVDKFKAASGWSTYADCIVPIPGTEVNAELPVATVEDAGKVLKVDSNGQWSKGEDNSVIYWKSF